MTHDEINKRIREKFNIKYAVTDNLPRGSGRGVGRKQLAELWNDLGYKTGAEIGVRKAKFSTHICRCIPEVHLYCIDPWVPYARRRYSKQRQDEYWRISVKALEPYNTTILRMTSMDALDKFKDDQLDFVFIDGDHQFDAVMLDLIHWSRKIRSGGMIALHDYYHFNWSGVVEAVRAYTHCHKIDPWYVTKELEPTCYWVKP
jgi:hypothetical protein